VLIHDNLNGHSLQGSVLESEKTSANGADQLVPAKIDIGTIDLEDWGKVGSGRGLQANLFERYGKAEKVVIKASDIELNSLTTAKILPSLL
jgi:hypothetical protein